MTTAPEHRCPACGGPVQRRRRHGPDRLVRGYRRYSCMNAPCIWAGLLPALEQEASPTTWLASWKARRERPAGRSVVTMVAGALLAAGATAWVLHRPAPEAVMVGPHVVTRGTHLEGERLPLAHPLKSMLPPKAMEDEPRGYLEEAGAVLRVRRNCAWGLPGRNPYRGSAVQALQTATLSATVVKKIAADIHAGRRVDRVTIRNDGIRAHGTGREFDPQRVAMTYGMTLCVDTRINFKGSHTEEGDLYEAMDDDGRMYAVMVPDVCGNVSVLGERYVQAEPLPEVAGARYAAEGDAAEDPRPWMRLPPERRRRELPPALRYADMDTDPPGKPGVLADRTVPTPGTLALTGLGLALALVLGGRRRR